MGATREGRGVHPFEHAAPETLAEALALLREHGAEAKVLAGGQRVVALDARLTLASASGSRTVPARDFFTGYLSTALAPDELLTAIEVPVTLGMGWAVEEFARRAGDFAVVAVAAGVSLDRRGRVDDARLALGGVADRPVRATAAEDVLRGQEPSAERLARAAEVVRERLDPQSDAFAAGAD